MNFLIMKSIVEATLANFECKTCSSKITDRDVQIIGASGQGVNMEVLCPHCKASGMIKAEINVIGDPADVAKLQASGMLDGTIIQGESLATNQLPAIKDDDILALREKLRHSVSIEDLLS